MKMRRLQRGFTLIEVMIVVVIIGLLASVATVKVVQHIENARKARARADIETISVSLNCYYMATSRFPKTLDVLASGPDAQMPELPKTPWGGEYQYTYPGTHKAYPFDVQVVAPDGTVIANWSKYGS